MKIYILGDIFIFYDILHFDEQNANYSYKY
jgi:hypothetical protein